MKPKRQKLLLINPPYSRMTYEEVDRRAGTLQNPILSLATIAAPVLQAEHSVRILDMDLCVRPYHRLWQTLHTFKPDVVGVTGTTPMAAEMAKIAALSKKLCPKALLIAGGVHVTTFPEETLLDTEFDVVAIGEADFVLADVLGGSSLAEVQGICFKENGEPVHTEPRPPIVDLDELPMPAWELYDIYRYRASRIVERRSPTGLIETSRGCVFKCVYCNKNVFGRRFRTKSSGRVVDELAHMLRVGFREIHIEDDGFSTDVKRAKDICDEIIRRRLKFPWTLINGIRVDRADEELMHKLKQAGCYQVAFGLESGNQEILDGIRKNVNKEQAREAIRLAKKAGLETFGFFMFGLPGETEHTMQETIDFAVELDLDIAKFAFTIPLPGTELFDEWDKQGLILTKDWSKYLFHETSSSVYKHPTLDWETIVRYYKKAYRSFYFRPRFMLRRAARGLLTGGIFYDLCYVLRTSWW